MHNIDFTSLCTWQLDCCEKCRDFILKCKTKNEETISKIKKKNRDSYLRRKQNLTDGYIRGVIRSRTGVNKSKIPKSLVAAGKQFIINEQLIKNLKTKTK